MELKQISTSLTEYYSTASVDRMQIWQSSSWRSWVLRDRTKRDPESTRHGTKNGGEEMRKGEKEERRKKQFQTERVGVGEGG
jgi:hypothetical protein